MIGHPSSCALRHDSSDTWAEREDRGINLAGFDTRVVASHGRRLRLRLPNGAETLGRPLRRDLQIVCGDEVRCEYDARHAETRILACAPRHTALYRSNARGDAELIAANVTLLLVVVAPLPVPDFFLVDRYLAAARCSDMQAAVLANKSDLGFDAGAIAELAAFGRSGYECLHMSAHTQAGLEALRAAIRGQTSMLVGQSGTGKSSLLRALVPDTGAAIGELVRSTEDGRHTTTTARLYMLPTGGELIDAPGVRDFAPAIDHLDAATLGFVEIAQLARGCRFADCRHLREPECAVRAALGGAMSARRYESYRRLRRLFETLTAAGPRRR